MVRVGLEPTNTEVGHRRTRWSHQSLCQLAHQTVFQSSSPRNRTLSNGFEDRRANPSHSQAMLFPSVSMSGIEPDLRPSQGRVRIHYTSQTFFTKWCRWDSNPQTLVPKTSRSAVGVPHQSSRDAIEIRTQPNMFCRHVPHQAE